MESAICGGTEVRRWTRRNLIGILVMGVSGCCCLPLFADAPPNVAGQAGRLHVGGHATRALRPPAPFELSCDAPMGTGRVVVCRPIDLAQRE